MIVEYVSLKTLRTLAPYLVGAALVLGLWVYMGVRESRAYARGKLDAESAMVIARTAELERQVEANRKALADSRAAIRNLNADREALTRTLEENAVASLADPNAAACALSPGSVQRLNRLR